MAPDTCLASIQKNSEGWNEKNNKARQSLRVLPVEDIEQPQQNQGRSPKQHFRRKNTRIPHQHLTCLQIQHWHMPLGVCYLSGVLLAANLRMRVLQNLHVRRSNTSWCVYARQRNTSSLVLQEGRANDGISVVLLFMFSKKVFFCPAN